MRENLRSLKENLDILNRSYLDKLEENEKLVNTQTQVQTEYYDIKQKYNHLMDENPSKLKQMQQDLIRKYNDLIGEKKKKKYFGFKINLILVLRKLIYFLFRKDGKIRFLNAFFFLKKKFS